MLKEFKDFAMRGNMVDMAVGIIIGAAFGSIIKSLATDVLMPPIGLLLGDVDFSNIFMVLKEGATAAPYASLDAAKEAGAVVMSWGVFINTIINFIIIAFVLFLVIRNMNKMKQKEEAPPAEPTTKECPQCLSAIPIKAVRCAFCTTEIKAA
ncbi:MAG: large conductance mechanosensitive channel protein MscL [Candidatus Krumholzibacteria bacterium]|nr:large conductance mechanosensitive channel protein MscL [Candidatus Krumholzibacteria bacterium]